MPDSTRNLPPDDTPTAPFRPRGDTPDGTTAAADTAVDRQSGPADVRAAAAEFDRLWDTTAPPEIRRFVPPDHPQPLAVLAELVVIDARRRRSAGLSVRVTEYLAEFPELFDRINTVAELNRLADGPPAPPGYDLLDEVGRGGMGVVYRARETSLDRDVAVKVLRDDYAPGSTAARRFLEEARITSQLQHPGIPPVHAVGMLADARPFLVMKLIKGLTLAQLLKERADPAADHGRFLEVFERVCQAVGYAHAHGVIHRDLKPGNVMVGAFGEVQVMDWGLAKVLTEDQRPTPPPPTQETHPGTEIRTPRSEDEATRLGTVMGTPAYMPPEQANGHVDRVDRRSDVFALGGMLCSLLTGLPPYTGGDSETRAKAELGLTDEAFRRLDGCRADPELVVLAKRCLARIPAERPADATEVARLVADHREGVEARLRAAERDRAAADVRADEQRRRRKLAGTAAAAVAVILGAAAGVSAWQAGIARGEAANARKAETTAHDEAEAARKAEAAAVAARNAEKQVREDSDDVATFMATVFNFASSGGQGKQPLKEPTVKQALDNAEALMRDRFVGRPLVEARARKFLADAYHGLRDFEGALPHLRRRLEINRRELGDGAEATLADTNNLGQVLLQVGNKYHDEAILAIKAGRSGDEPALMDKANRYYAEAEQALTDALARKRQMLGNKNLSTIKGMNNLAGVYRQQGRAEARAFAADPTVVNLPRLARVTRLMGETDALQWEAYQTSRAVLEPYHDEILKTTNGMGAIRIDQGRLADAEAFFREAAEGYQHTIGPKYYTAQCWSNVGDVLLRQEKFADAEAEYRKVLAILDRIPPQEAAGLRKQIDLRMAKIRAATGEIPPPREAKGE